MTLETIERHPLPFWNGRFRIFPSSLRGGRDHLLDSQDPSIISPNSEIASLALYQFANKPETAQYDLFLLLAKLTRLRGMVWSPDARQILLAREIKMLSTLPSVTSAEINDQSKGDPIVKGAAVFQVLYLILQLLARFAAHQPSSQLEVMVVAFAACASVTYTLFLSKPQGVSLPRNISATQYATPSEMIELTKAGPIIVSPSPIKSYAIPTEAFHHCGTSSRYFNSTGASLGGQIFVLGSVLGSIIFGSIHCAAWYFAFPSPTERLL